MGQTATKAVTKAKQDAQDGTIASADKVINMLELLNSKAKEFEARLKLSRGSGNETSNIEISGGRTASRLVEVRASTSSTPDEEITKGIASFFELAQGGDKGKKAAVEGAKSLLTAGINALFGISGGTGMEKQGFVVLYMNFAFVRVDYLVYTYLAEGTSWGATNSVGGACYVCDLSILDPKDC